jgi:hypothetical protein
VQGQNWSRQDVMNYIYVLEWVLQYIHATLTHANKQHFKITYIFFFFKHFLSQDKDQEGVEREKKREREREREREEREREGERERGDTMIIR